MYKGFRVSLNDEEFGWISGLLYRKWGGWSALVNEFYKDEIKYYNAYRNKVRRQIDDFVRNNGVIDGGKLQDEWFQHEEADIFISHSHKDEKLAVAFAGWLRKNFNIKAFIDSMVWGYAADLQKSLDEKYSDISDNDNNFVWKKNLFDYTQSNYVGTFVNNILTGALSKMIDSCEALMFINTPNSIRVDTLDSETSSSWIYYELLLSRLIRKKELRRVRNFNHGGPIQEAIKDDFKFSLPADQFHLLKLDNDILCRWRNVVKGFPKYTSPQFSLDVLYYLCKEKGDKK